MPILPPPPPGLAKVPHSSTASLPTGGAHLATPPVPSQELKATHPGWPSHCPSTGLPAPNDVRKGTTNQCLSSVSSDERTSSLNRSSKIGQIPLPVMTSAEPTGRQGGRLRRVVKVGLNRHQTTWSRRSVVIWLGEHVAAF